MGEARRVRIREGGILLVLGRGERGGFDEGKGEGPGGEGMGREGK